MGLTFRLLCLLQHLHQLSRHSRLLYSPRSFRFPDRKSYLSDEGYSGGPEKNLQSNELVMMELRWVNKKLLFPCTEIVFPKNNT